MKNLLLVFFFFNFSAYSQNIDTIWINNKFEQSAKEKASFYKVIKKNKNSKDYTIIDYYMNGKKEMSGIYLSLDTPQFKNGKFNWWYQNGHKKAERIYENDDLKKEIVWDLKGNITETHEYNKLIRFENQRKIIEILKVDANPAFPGGLTAFYTFLSHHYNYPKHFDKISGKIIVGFTIDTTGRITDAVIKQGLHPILDQEALRVVLKSPKWSPGKLDGKFVEVKYDVPINIDFP